MDTVLLRIVALDDLLEVLFREREVPYPVEGPPQRVVRLQELARILTSLGQTQCAGRATVNGFEAGRFGDGNLSPACFARK